MKNYEGYVGVFDSGVGGISVLRELIRENPKESFLYFGDSANAPYGEKTIEQVRQLSLGIVERMISQGVKAIVVACNTATSASVREIRSRYPGMPVIGIEPAVKPAALAGERKQKVLVMATPMTIALPKLHRLQATLDKEAEFVSLACPGLAARIEKGNLWAPDLLELLHKLLDEQRGKVDSVVLGCTHYPFIKEQIRQVLGELPMYDGGAGTARELRRELQQFQLKETRDQQGQVVFQSSLDSEDELALYQRFLEM